MEKKKWSFFLVALLPKPEVIWDENKNKISYFFKCFARLFLLSIKFENNPLLLIGLINHLMMNRNFL